MKYEETTGRATGGRWCVAPPSQSGKLVASRKALGTPAGKWRGLPNFVWIPGHCSRIAFGFFATPENEHGNGVGVGEDTLRLLRGSFCRERSSV